MMPAHTTRGGWEKDVFIGIGEVPGAQDLGSFSKNLAKPDPHSRPQIRHPARRWSYFRLGSPCHAGIPGLSCCSARWPDRRDSSHQQPAGRWISLSLFLPPASRFAPALSFSQRARGGKHGQLLRRCFHAGGIQPPGNDPDLDTRLGDLCCRYSPETGRSGGQCDAPGAPVFPERPGSEIRWHIRGYNLILPLSWKYTQ